MNRKIALFALATLVFLYGIAFAASSSSDYRAGYAKGLELGKNHARSGSGMPYDFAITAMAKIWSEKGKPNDPTEYQNGFESGFRDGFTSIKPSKRKAENYEALSWQNALPGTKLYDNEGTHEVTIVSVDKRRGIIVVKYVKGGTVEPKKLNAISRFWFVRKNQT